MRQSIKSIARIGHSGVIAGATLFVGATGNVLAHEGSAELGGGMMDGSWGMFGGWGFLWVLLLIGAAVLVISALSRSNQTQNSDQPGRAQDVLRKRYARGELSDEEFEKRRRKLQPTRAFEEDING